MLSNAATAIPEVLATVLKFVMENLFAPMQVFASEMRLLVYLVERSAEALSYASCAAPSDNEPPLPVQFLDALPWVALTTRRTLFCWKFVNGACSMKP